MKLKKAFYLMLTISMLLTSSAYAAGNVEARSGTGPEGVTVNVLNLADGKLTAYDENGVETVSYLTQEQITEKLAEAESVAADQIGAKTVNTTQHVSIPREIDGNQAVSIGNFNTYPHFNLYVHVVYLTYVPNMNIILESPDGSRVWRENVSQGQVVWFNINNPSLDYKIKVSTNGDRTGAGALKIYST
ncbi:hypothetical protein A8L34_02325 [Bacillus sp. FJAT-27264]|uniref:hypothetical protein n=1 Tax=Paenibacillus sp. (strain DSM 101736 / FJAT-27264) TaxID=1850362 RepID=UPI000807BAC7|nr:hypothetical protein [Bacillus sp. FJAT-27264]OBZ18441.1 hypothetical protein A8L34_02325 [Bacillus sp. FJAT-27264]